jgi:hypothetical protein
MWWVGHLSEEEVEAGVGLALRRGGPIGLGLEITMERN